MLMIYEITSIFCMNQGPTIYRIEYDGTAGLSVNHANYFFSSCFPFKLAIHLNPQSI